MVTSENFDIGATLNALIARSGKQKKALAEYTGVSEQAVQKWINQGTIAREKVREICTFLDCSADELFGLAPIAEDVRSESQLLGIDTEMLKSAIVAVKEALRSLGLELDAFLAAPMIAYAYAERITLPRDMTKTEYKAFDVMVTAKLRGELGNVAEDRSAETGKGSPKTAKAGEKEARSRRFNRGRRVPPPTGRR